MTNSWLTINVLESTERAVCFFEIFSHQKAKSRESYVARLSPWPRIVIGRSTFFINAIIVYVKVYNLLNE